jgi:hypothetical protein
MWLPLVTLLLSQTPSTVDARLLEAALQLGGPESARAEAQLGADPSASLPALSVVARAQGVDALGPLFRAAPVQCPNGEMMMGSMRPMELTAGHHAASLLGRLAQENEAFRLQLAQSGRPLELFIAVMSAWQDDAALERLAPRIEVPVLSERERRLVSALQFCVTSRGGFGSKKGAILSRLASAKTSSPPCDTAADGSAIATRGTVKQKGWSLSGDVMTLTFEVKGVSLHATPACALAIYDAQRDPALILPLLRAPKPEMALDRLERDLARYEGDSQKSALRALLANGRQLARIGDFSVDERRWSDELLRGSLLANTPDAKDLLLSRISCPSSDDEVELLTLLKDKAVAKTEAARLVKMCPRVGAAAASVLAGQGDTSWVASLPRLFEDSFGRYKLERLVEARWSAKLEAQLRALPSNNEEFTKWRTSMLSKQRR